MAGRSRSGRGSPPPCSPAAAPRRATTRAPAEPVIMGMSDEVLATDPASGYDPGSWLVFNNVFQSLLSFPEGGTDPQPEAAEQCGFKDTPARLHLHAARRPEVQQRPSADLEDVKYSFDRTLRINDGDGPAVMLATIDNIETPDDRTVVFKLKTPDATFPQKIASGAGSIVDHREYPPKGSAPTTRPSAPASTSWTPSQRRRPTSPSTRTTRAPPRPEHRHDHEVLPRRPAAAEGGRRRRRRRPRLPRA